MRPVECSGRDDAPRASTAAPPIHASRFASSRRRRRTAPRREARRTAARREPTRNRQRTGIGATLPAFTKPLQGDDLELTPRGETRRERRISASLPRMVQPPSPQQPFVLPAARRRAATSMRAAVKSLLLVACAGLVLALGDCRAGGRRDAVLEGAHQRLVRRHDRQDVPAGVLHGRRSSTCRRTSTSYSSAKDDIERALLAAFAAGTAAATAVARRRATDRRAAPHDAPERRHRLDRARARKGVILRAIEWLGPSDAASVPLPLLILAGVAFLLLAAAGGSFVNRRLQERRLPPPPQA